MQIDKDTLQGRRKQGGQGAAPPIFHKGGRDSFRPPPPKKNTAKFSKLEIFETVYIILTGAALTLFEWGGVSDLLPTVVWSFCRVISL